MKDTLNVWYESKRIGTITRRGKIHMVFAYAPDWIRTGFPLSLSLPLQRAPFSQKKTRAFFDNLLPEEKAREHAGKNLKVSPQNPYGLLYELGAECAGALSILPKNTTPEKSGHPQLFRLSNTDLITIIKELPKRPLLAGEKGIRLSLAGAQAKLPLVWDGKNFYFSLNGSPSTHLIKPTITDLPESVENEAFCMFLAKVTGLQTAATAITDTRPRAYVVERYDRKIKKESIKRIHQEDFCQALSVPPELKYENEGGPGFADCFQLLHHCHNPEQDKLSLFQWAVFNFIIGNADGHAKNLSLLYDHPPKPRLAPFYDLMSTAVYEGLTTRLSMQIGKQKNPDFVMQRHWERLGALAGWDAKTSVFHLNDITKRTIGTANRAADVFCKKYGESPVVRHICRIIAKRSQKILNNFNKKNS